MPLSFCCVVTINVEPSHVLESLKLLFPASIILHLPRVNYLCHNSVQLLMLARSFYNVLYPLDFHPSSWSLSLNTMRSQETLEEKSKELENLALAIGLTVFCRVLISVTTVWNQIKSTEVNWVISGLCLCNWDQNEDHFKIAAARHMGNINQQIWQPGLDLIFCTD